MKKDGVMEKLSEVMDPETDLSIVDMGFIYEVEMENGEVDIEMTLTSPGCPLHSRFTQEVREKVSEIDGVEEVDVELVFDPPWTPDKMSEEAKKKLGMTDDE